MEGAEKVPLMEGGYSPELPSPCGRGREVEATGVAPVRDAGGKSGPSTTRPPFCLGSARRWGGPIPNLCASIIALGFAVESPKRPLPPKQVDGCEHLRRPPNRRTLNGDSPVPMSSRTTRSAISSNSVASGLIIAKGAPFLWPATEIRPPATPQRGADCEEKITVKTPCSAHLALGHRLTE
jgi:hypothetical protein